jgi:hypothetical protein
MKLVPVSEQNSHPLTVIRDMPAGHFDRLPSGALLEGLE